MEDKNEIDEGRIALGAKSERETIMDELARSIEVGRRLSCLGGVLEACGSLVLAVRFVNGCDVHMYVLPLCGILLGLLFVIDGRMSRAEAFSRAAFDMQLLGDMKGLPSGSCDAADGAEGRDG